ncbi:phage baseplate plug family protein [Serratia fonticola]|uniref:phage baseplate plug family protein n=1 Tax=Serratia fonticola TaxID=47917 RepID=UPI00358DA7B2
MQEITLLPRRGQILNLTLAGQVCRLRIVQRTTGLFMDVSLNGRWIVQGVICLNCVKLVRYKHLGFLGELFFTDTVGDSDPIFDELGTRFKLFYATQHEVEAAQ